MQLLLLAPRVLRDISADNIIPITNRLGFHLSNARGLPVRAIALSMLIALPFIFVPSLVRCWVVRLFEVVTTFRFTLFLSVSYVARFQSVICSDRQDFITTVVTMIFLLNYFSVNLTCALISTLKLHSWRPKFR